MGTATLVSVDEYLATSYRPDCDFVDGELIERNLGTPDHSNLQRATIVWFENRRRELRLSAYPEMRIRVSPSRYRIPDLCVIPPPMPRGQFLTQPPYICIEVLSPEDSFSKYQTRLDDYLEMGVPNIWVIDPPSRRGWSIAREGHFEALDGVLRTGDGRVAMPMAELFRSEE